MRLYFIIVLFCPHRRSLWTSCCVTREQKHDVEHTHKPATLTTTSLFLGDHAQSSNICTHVYSTNKSAVPATTLRHLVLWWPRCMVLEIDRLSLHHAGAGKQIAFTHLPHPWCIDTKNKFAYPFLYFKRHRQQQTLMSPTAAACRHSRRQTSIYNIRAEPWWSS